MWNHQPKKSIRLIDLGHAQPAETSRNYSLIAEEHMAMKHLRSCRAIATHSVIVTDAFSVGRTMLRVVDHYCGEEEVVGLRKVAKHLAKEETKDRWTFEDGPSWQSYMQPLSVLQK